MADTPGRAKTFVRWLWRVIIRVTDGEITIAAGGIALFGLLAAIPTLAAVVAVYALIADPSDITNHMVPLRHVVPGAVVSFIITQLKRASAAGDSLSITLISSLLVAIYSARNAVNGLTEGLSRAYRVPDERSFFRALLRSIGFAAGALLAMLTVVVLLVALPAIGTLLRLDDRLVSFVEFVRWPALLVVTCSILTLVYRNAAGGKPLRRREHVPGAIIATVAWLLVSFGLSLWVEQVANYDILYGAFASVVVLILWFYMSAMCVLIGGVVNAESSAVWKRPNAPESVGS